MSDAVQVTSEAKGPAVVLRVEETQILADRADTFRRCLLAAVPPVGGRVAVDLRKVDFLDSSGLGALVSLLKAVRPEGELVLFGVRASVREILRLTHLDAVFPCEEDEAKALATLLGSSRTR